METWRNLGHEPVVCHNRMRAVSLNDDDTASFARITSASSENEVQPTTTSSNNNLNTVVENNNKDQAPSLESYITATITSSSANNRSVEAKTHCRHVPHAENRKVSWEERMNDYSFMKRWCFASGPAVDWCVFNCCQTIIICNFLMGYICGWLDHNCTITNTHTLCALRLWTPTRLVTVFFHLCSDSFLFLNVQKKYYHTYFVKFLTKSYKKIFS